MLISQPNIDKIKKAYSNIDDMKKSSVWGNMSTDMQESLMNLYKDDSLIKTNDNTTTTLTKKPYVWKDGKGRNVTQFAYEAQKKAGNDMSGFQMIADIKTPEQVYEAVQPSTTSTDEPGSNVIESTPTFTSDSFKKLAEDNLKTQLAKNAELQKTLDDQKLAADAAYKPIMDKFSTAQTEALANIDKLEKEWKKNFDMIQLQNQKYYIDQNAALDAQLGGEQAGVANTLQSKGINTGVIGNAIQQVREAHQGQYNALLKNNTDIANTLNQQYLNFAKDIQGQKDLWSTNELALMKDKFTYGKAIIDESKKVQQDTINATYKPYQDAIDQVSTAEATAANYQARDNIDIARYSEGTPEQRKLLLMARLGLDSPTNAYGVTTNFDIKLLDEAAKQGSLSEAIAMLGKTYQAAQAAGSNVDSSVLKSVASTIAKTTPKTEPKKEEVAKPAIEPKVGKEEHIAPNGKKYTVVTKDGMSTFISNATGKKVTMKSSDVLKYIDENNKKPAVTDTKPEVAEVKDKPKFYVDKDFNAELTAIQKNTMQPMKDKQAAAGQLRSALIKERDAFRKKYNDGASMSGIAYENYKAYIAKYNKQLAAIDAHPLIKDIRVYNARI